ncbi:MAG TPA: hypothetical protein VHF65_01170 [Nitrososphaera sp.]|nr:hypothetical protein [Nitrososphaera sp.]
MPNNIITIGDKIIGFSFTVSLAYEAIINPDVAVGMGSLIPTQH